MHTRSTTTLLLLLGLTLTAACGKDSPTQPTATVQSVRLTASPTSLPASGGSTEITATVTLNTGAPGGGIPVTFTTDKGSFNVGSVTTRPGGHGQGPADHNRNGHRARDCQRRAGRSEG